MAHPEGLASESLIQGCDGCHTDLVGRASLDLAPLGLKWQVNWPYRPGVADIPVKSERDFRVSAEFGCVHRFE